MKFTLVCCTEFLNDHLTIFSQCSCHLFKTILLEVLLKSWKLCHPDNCQSLLRLPYFFNLSTWNSNQPTIKCPLHTGVPPSFNDRLQNSGKYRQGVPSIFQRHQIYFFPSINILRTHFFHTRFDFIIIFGGWWCMRMRSIWILYP